MHLILFRWPSGYQVLVREIVIERGREREREREGGGGGSQVSHFREIFLPQLPRLLISTSTWPWFLLRAAWRYEIERILF